MVCSRELGSEIQIPAVVIVGGEFVTLIPQPGEKIGIAVTVGAEAAVEFEGNDGKRTPVHQAGHAFENLPLRALDIDLAEIDPGIGSEHRVETDCFNNAPTRGRCGTGRHVGEHVAAIEGGLAGRIRCGDGKDRGVLDAVEFERASQSEHVPGIGFHAGNVAPAMRVEASSVWSPVLAPTSTK